MQILLILFKINPYGSTRTQAQFDCLLDTLHQHVKRLRLCVASTQSRNGRNEIPVRIPLNHYAEFIRHISASEISIAHLTAHSTWTLHITGRRFSAR